jgi:hypothetical protein
VNDRMDDTDADATRGPAQEQTEDRAGPSGAAGNPEASTPASSGNIPRPPAASSPEENGQSDDNGEPPDQHPEEAPDDADRKSEATGSRAADECALPTTTIQEELGKLREATSQAIKDKVTAEGAFADRENRLKVLEGVEREFPAVKKAYDDAYAQLRRDERDLVDYLECERKSLVALLKYPGVCQVRQRVMEYLATRRKLEHAVECAKEAAQEPPDPNAEVTRYTADLAAWKKIAGTIASQHAEIRKLRDDITKARQAGHYGLALFLLWKARWRRNEFARGCGPRLVDPSTLHQELHGAGERLAAAQHRLAVAQREASANRDALAAAIKNLDEHQRTAEATLQEALKEIEGADRARLGAQ